MGWSLNQNPGGGTGSPSTTAKSILNEMEILLSNIYADMDVSRERVRSVVARGEKLANKDDWEGAGESDAFLDSLRGLEQKIYKTLDLKKLKEEGLVKVVPL